MDQGLHFVRALNGSLSETRRVLQNRDRLLALDEGLPVLVIEGPSGYGKSVLAEMWLDRQRLEATCCWVSIDAASADPVLFLEQLMHAVGAGYPGRQEAGIDDEAGRAERFAFLCTHLADQGAGFRVVIDDVQLIAGPSLPYLKKLLGIASRKLRFCLTMQPMKVDLGLGGLAAQGQVTWIPARCLALSRQEVESFAALRGQTLTQVQADLLYRATEGWPALTQLALALPLDAAPFDEAGLSESGPLRSYIYERFFRGLSDDDQDVLWTLSCLGSAPIPLLIALDPPSAKVEIALLNFRALGIVQNRDPDDSTVVSLHALVRDAAMRFLRTSANRDRGRLIQEAAEWYWRNGCGAAAVRVALDDGPALATLARGWLIELGFSLAFRSGQHQTLLDLVERWESVAGVSDEEIDKIAAWALIFQRQFAQAEHRLDRVEAGRYEDPQATVALQRGVLLSLRDDFVQGGVLARRWIEQNEGRHTFHMGVASTVYAFSEKRAGNFEAAHVALREAMYCFNLAQSAYGIGWAHVVGSIVLVQAGRYRAALAQVESGLSRCPSSHGFGSLRALLRAVEAFVRYERNEPEPVREILGEALPLLADQGILDAVTLGYTAAARARATAADYGTALDILCEGELIGMQRDFPRLTAALRAERALLLVRSGAVSQARTIIDWFPADGPVRTNVNLLRARMALADGDGHLARSLLIPVLGRARRFGRQSRLCEILVQLALAEEQCASDASAFTALTEALDIGSSEGYIRTFLDEGRNLRSLLDRWLQHGSITSRPAECLARQLVAAGDGGSGGRPSQVSGATFNKRERQILGLLDEGLSNAQLAKRCFISEGTVKWYLHNLYEKLGVGNRTALLRAAREAGVKL